MYRFSRFFAAFIVWTALCAVPALAFDVSVKANVDNAQVFVGDMFNYEIQVTAPENAIVDLPSFVGNLGSFEVKEMKNEKVTEGMPKGTAKFVWFATLNTFVSGDFLIAPQQVNAVVGSDTVKVNTDPVAVKVARENIAVNGLSDRITAVEGNLLDRQDMLCEVCVANIIADVICGFAEPLTHHIVPGGLFICSGIIKEREQDVLDALKAANYEVLQIRRKGEWVAMLSRRP